MKSDVLIKPAERQLEKLSVEKSGVLGKVAQTNSSHSKPKEDKAVVAETAKAVVAESAKAKDAAAKQSTDSKAAENSKVTLATGKAVDASTAQTSAKDRIAKANEEGKKAKEATADSEARFR